MCWAALAAWHRALADLGFAPSNHQTGAVGRSPGGKHVSNDSKLLRWTGSGKGRFAHVSENGPDEKYLSDTTVLRQKGRRRYYWPQRPWPAFTLLLIFTGFSPFVQS